jgi:ribosomal protein S27E
MTDDLAGQIRRDRRDCIRRCTIHGQHQPACTCTPECGEHQDHCVGCQPTPATTGSLCLRCTATLRTALNALPELAVHAASRTDGKLSTPSTNTDATRRGTLAHAPSPSPAWDTAEEVIQWAYLNARACADDNHHTGPFLYRADGVPARNLTQTIRYITAHLPWYATDDPEQFYDEATSWKRALERLSGRDELTHRIKTPCPTCNHRTLVREDGADSVTCRNRDCGRIWREGEFDWMAHVAVS